MTAWDQKLSLAQTPSSPLFLSASGQKRTFTKRGGGVEDYKPLCRCFGSDQSIGSNRTISVGSPALSEMAT
jgi:hypothetical protein